MSCAFISATLAKVVLERARLIEHLAIEMQLQGADAGREVDDARDPLFLQPFVDDVDLEAELEVEMVRAEDTPGDSTRYPRWNVIARREGGGRGDDDEFGRREIWGDAASRDYGFG